MTKSAIENKTRPDDMPQMSNDDRDFGSRVGSGVTAKDDYSIAAGSKSGNERSNDVNIASGKASDTNGIDGSVKVNGELNNRTEVLMFDDFLRSPTLTDSDSDTASLLIAGPYIPLVGTTPGSVAIAAAYGGKAVLTTGGADGGPATDPVQISAYHPVKAEDGGLYFEAKLHINSAITNCRMFVGFTDVKTLECPASIATATITTTASDAVGFCYDDAATLKEWYAIAVDGNSDDAGCGTTGEGPVADTDQILRVEISADGTTCKFFIDGTLVKTLTGSYGVSPDVALYGIVYINTTAAAVKSADVDYVAIGHNRA